MSAVLRFLDGRFFPRYLATNLGVLRVLLGLYFAHFLWRYGAGYQRVAATTSADFFKPVGVCSFLSEPLAPATHQALLTATLVLSVLYVVGLGFRYVGPLFGLLFLFVLTYRQSWSFIYHTENHVVLHALVLGVAPAADRFSLDSVLRRLSSTSDAWIDVLRPALAPPAARALALIRPGGALHGLVRHLTHVPRDVNAPDWRYGAPIAFILFVTGIAYWVAAMAKYGRAGPDWLLETHLLDHIANNALRYEFLKDYRNPLTYFVFQLPEAAIAALAGFSFFVELLGPAVILHRYVAWFFALSFFCFHWGVFHLMSIPFMYQLYGFAFAPFVRWDLVILRLQDLIYRKLGLAPPGDPPGISR